MKKFTQIKENLENINYELLFSEILKLKSWLYKANGLGMMKIIDDIFSENRYRNPLTKIQIDKFNNGVDLLKKTSMPLPYINSQLSYKIPHTIYNVKLVLDDSGNWHHVNKLNTNHSDLSCLLVELIKRGCEKNIEKGIIVYNSIIKDPKTGLLSIKPYLKKLIEYYFIENGNGLEDFKKFTKYSTIMSKVGEIAEEKVLNYLESKGYSIEYCGGNGDFIDMIYGTDLIIYKDGEYKTVQIKNKIKDWSSLEHYKVDWVVETKPIVIYNLSDKSIVNI